MPWPGAEEDPPDRCGHVDALDGHSVPLIVDEAGEFQSVYGPTGGTRYLVRPDGYVGSAQHPDLRASLRSHLNACSPPSPSRDKWVMTPS